MAQGEAKVRLHKSDDYGALGISLYSGEWIEIGDDIKVILQRTRGKDFVALTIIAPKSTKIKRSGVKTWGANREGS